VPLADAPRHSARPTKHDGEKEATLTRYARSGPA
jgi:hypothetical protein